MINSVLDLLSLRYWQGTQSETCRTGVLKYLYIGIENRLLCITHLKCHKGKVDEYRKAKRLKSTVKCNAIVWKSKESKSKEGWKGMF